MYCLGKKPAKVDHRNLKFRALLPKKLPEPPPEYDVDFDNEDIWPLPLPMFGNSEWGDCVIAGRAHFTLRLEKLEQGKIIDITDQDVLEEYWREQGGDSITRPDEGLYVLDSLKSWRNEGWQAAGQRYNIYAFAEISKTKIKEIKTAIWLLGGLMVGVSLYQEDMDAIDQKKIWDVSDNRGKFVGGHLMYCLGFTRSGLVFLTWAQRMVATWSWVMNRVDEVYGIVDDRDKFMDSTLDVDRLDEFLHAVTA